MRWLGYLIVGISLVVGVASATTAYLPPLSLPDERLVGLTLNADAGAVFDPELGPRERPQPIGRDDDLLTAQLLQQLRAAGVQRVRVKEFSPGRWSEAWLFALSVAGLIAGAVLVRAGTTRAYHLSPQQAETAGSPAHSLKMIGETMAALQAELKAKSSDQQHLATIVAHLGRVQREYVPAFAEGRGVLVARLGLAGFARAMDRFAAMERQINRAWSAAADGQYPEAIECLERAAGFLEETEAAL